MERVAIRYAAQNQTVSGSFDACITVPAVTGVCRPQPAHSQVNALLESSQPLACPHDGQRTRPASAIGNPLKRRDKLTHSA